MITKKKIINGVLVKVWKQFWRVEVIDKANQKRITRRAFLTVALTFFFLMLAIVCNSQLIVKPYLGNRGLVFKSVYPFDWSKTYVYECLFVWQYYSAWYTLFMINGFDLLFIPLVMTCSIQFIIMQEVFKSIPDKRSRGHRMKIFGEWGEFMSNKDMLAKCIDQHKLLLG